MYIKLFEDFSEKVQLIEEVFERLHDDFDLEFKINTEWNRRLNPRNFSVIFTRIYSVKFTFEKIPDLESFSKIIQEICQMCESYCDIKFHRLYVESSGVCASKIDQIPYEILNSTVEVLDVRLNTYEDVIVLDELTIEFLDPKEQN